MKPTSTRTRHLSLGSRCRHFAGFVIVLTALLPGIAAAQNQAPIFDWAGTVQVSQDGSNPSSSSFTLSLKAGESKTYYLETDEAATNDGWGTGGRVVGQDSCQRRGAH